MDVEVFIHIGVDEHRPPSLMGAGSRPGVLGSAEFLCTEPRRVPRRAPARLLPRPRLPPRGKAENEQPGITILDEGLSESLPRFVCGWQNIGNRLYPCSLRSRTGKGRTAPSRDGSSRRVSSREAPASHCPNHDARASAFGHGAGAPGQRACTLSNENNLASLRGEMQ